MHKGRAVKLAVRADGSGLVSHAGSALLSGLADRLGLTDSLDRALEAVCERWRRHAPGAVIRDLAVMLADGGDCLSDLGALREQQALFGDVASDATAHRLIRQIAELPDGLERLRAARAEARSRAIRRGVRPREWRIDLDATLVDAHSGKEGAAATFKHGVGFHPMLAHLDGTGDALAGRLRPGNANANTAADQIAVLADALEQLPRRIAAREPVLLRADSAGATHELLEFCHDGNLRFSVGLPLTETVRAAILALPEAAWQTALTQDCQPRDHDGAQVAELTGLLDLSAWPAGSRVLVRREQPHPGAQFSFTDHDGRRFQAILTDQPDGDIAYLRPPTAGTRASRTASAPPRTPALRTSHSATSRSTRCGWSSSCSPKTSPRGHNGCCWRASWWAPSRSGCVTGCCTPPHGSPCTPATRSSICPPAGPGRLRWRPRSAARTRWRPPAADRQPTD